MAERTANEIRAAREAARTHLQFEGTEALCLAIIAAEDAAMGYPRAGTPTGPGPHEEQAWDGRGSPPPGWTVSYAVPEEKHDEPGVFACPVRTDAMTTRLVRAGLVSERDVKVRDRDAWRRPEEEE